MLRLIALFAVLINLLAGALPSGAVLHVAKDGRLAIEPSACCAMPADGPDLAVVHGQSRPMQCCCFTGVLIGHDDLHPGLPTGCELPVLPPVDAWWAAGLFEHVRGASPGALSRARHHPPPPLGALRPDTVVIRC